MDDRQRAGFRAVRGLLADAIGDVEQSRQQCAEEQIVSVTIARVMGTLRYGYKGRSYDFDDRTLAHLRIAIVSKLRRHESFMLSFSFTTSRGEVRETIWMDPSIPVRFTIGELDESAGVNRAWIEHLGRSAASGVMKVTAEPLT